MKRMIKLIGSLILALYMALTMQSAVVLAEGSDIVINESYFPDEKFRNWLKGQEYGKDGKLTSEEIAEITDINVYDKFIVDLRGIEYFTALTKLNCGSNQLTSLDVSSNTALIDLRCHDNQLTSLDVSKNIALTELGCYDNQLTSLDVSKNTELMLLQCHSNQLVTLDLDKNPNMINKLLICHDQNISVEMIGSDGQYSAYVTMNGSTEFSSTALSYDESRGMLISIDNTVTSATFSSPTTSTDSLNKLTGTLTLTYKEDVDITGVHVANKTYDGVPITYTGEPTNAQGYTDTYEFVWSSGSAPKNAGTYELTVKIPDSDESYRGELVIPFTIEKATITITAKNKSAYVGDPLPTLSASDYILAGLATGETLISVPTLTYSEVPDMTKAGTYMINASGAAVPESGNYNITYIPGTLTISNRPSGGGSEPGGGSGSGGSGTGGSSDSGGSGTDGSSDSGSSGSGVINLPLTTDEILNELEKKELTGIRLEVTLPEQGDDTDHVENKLILEKVVIKKAKDNKKDIVVDVKSSNNKLLYSWTFDKTELANSDKKINDVNLVLNVEKAPDDADFIDEQTNDYVPLVIDFAHEGLLPAQASVRIYVGNQEGITPGKKVYLYHYNEKIGKLETIPYGYQIIVDEDGYITVNILQCSDYVAFMKEADSKLFVSLRKQIKVTPTKITLSLTEGKNSSKITVNLPVTLEWVDSLDVPTSQSAMGGVTIKFTSSDYEIATVDSQGNITAKAPGEVVIKATITLYSKKTINVKTVVKVKS